jgi:hypothetical protein
MFKKTILVDEHSDPETTIRQFQESCRNSGIAEPDELVNQVESAISEFTHRGSELVAVGSQFSIKREIVGSDHKIIVHASFGEKNSILNKVTRLFGR